MKYLAVFVILCALICGYAKSEPKDMVVFIRVDDLFLINTEIFPQEIDAFLQIAERYGAGVVLSTIPARLRQRPNIDGKMSEQILDYARRGHQIAQHGYNHICPFTGTTNNEFYTPDIEGYSREERLAKILEGKKMLESVIGRKVVSYVGPGQDHILMPEEDEQALYAMGFINIPSASYNEDGSQQSIGLRMPAVDYAWQLTPGNYEERMKECKAAFLEAAKTDSEWSLQFHDHFTRAAYKDGLVLQWFDEIMDWLHNLEDYSISHPTFEDYYRLFYPGFTSEFK